MEPTRTPTLAPYLVANRARGLVRLLEQGLEGELTYVEDRPNGRIRHAEVRIADSLVMLADAVSVGETFPAIVHLDVPGVDVAHRRARGSGASSVHPPTDEPYGDRRGGVRDAWGNPWWFTRPVGPSPGPS